MLTAVRCCKQTDIYAGKCRRSRKLAEWLLRAHRVQWYPIRRRRKVQRLFGRCKFLRAVFSKLKQLLPWQRQLLLLGELMLAMWQCMSNFGSDAWHGTSLACHKTYAAAAQALTCMASASGADMITLSRSMLSRSSNSSRSTAVTVARELCRIGKRDGAQGRAHDTVSVGTTSYR